MFTLIAERGQIFENHQCPSNRDHLARALLSEIYVSGFGHEVKLAYANLAKRKILTE